MCPFQPRHSAHWGPSPSPLNPPQPLRGATPPPWGAEPPDPQVRSQSTNPTPPPNTSVGNHPHKAPNPQYPPQRLQTPPSYPLKLPDSQQPPQAQYPNAPPTAPNTPHAPPHQPPSLQHQTPPTTPLQTPHLSQRSPSQSPTPLNAPQTPTTPPHTQGKPTLKHQTHNAPPQTQIPQHPPTPRNPPDPPNTPQEPHTPLPDAQTPSEPHTPGRPPPFLLTVVGDDLIVAVQARGAVAQQHEVPAAASRAPHEVEQEGAALQAGGALRGDTARLATGLRCSPVPPPARPRPTDPLGVLRAHTAPAHLAASRETSAAQRGAGLALEGAWLRLATPPPRARGAEWGQPGLVGG